MRSDKAVKRTKCYVYRRSQLQNKRKSVIAKRNNIITWLNSVNQNKADTVVHVNDSSKNVVKTSQKNANAAAKKEAQKVKQENDALKRQEQLRKAEEQKQQRLQKNAAKVEAENTRKAEEDKKKAQKAAQQKAKKEIAVKAKTELAAEQKTKGTTQEHAVKKTFETEGKVATVTEKKGDASSTGKEAEKKVAAQQKSDKKIEEIVVKKIEKVVETQNGSAQNGHVSVVTENNAANDDGKNAAAKSKKKNRKNNNKATDVTDSKQETVECAGSTSTAGDKELTQLVLEINENAPTQDAPHTKCSTDSGFTDFQSGKTKKNLNNSEESLNGNKSSSNVSNSDDVLPKTPTSTPVDASLNEKVAQNGVNAVPIQESSKFAETVAQFATHVQQMQFQKAESTPLRHIHIEPIVPLLLPPKVERPKPRERIYKLLPRDIQYCAHMIENYGENFEAMAKDAKNVYLDTAASLKRKLRIFRESPQYETYLKAKAEGIPIENIA